MNVAMAPIRNPGAQSGRRHSSSFNFGSPDEKRSAFQDCVRKKLIHLPLNSAKKNTTLNDLFGMLDQGLGLVSWHIHLEFHISMHIFLCFCFPVTNLEHSPPTPHFKPTISSSS
ncbi:UNVERIFIED_CONTAM: hypothetical protein K2H54_069702 [Gekko kuhli]